MSLPNRFSPRPALLLLAALAAGLPQPSRAQVPSAPPAAEEETAEKPAEKPEKPAVPEDMRHPRAVMEAFITRMRADDKKGAAELLDLSKFSSAAGGSRGPDLAFKLYAILQRLVRLPSQNGTDDVAVLFLEGSVPFEKIPDDPEHKPWSVNEWTEATDEEAKRIVVAPDEEGRWKFSSATIADIDALYEATEDKEVIAAPTGGDEPTETFEVTLRNAFSFYKPLQKTYFLLPNYQWLLLLTIAPIGRMVEKTSRLVLTWFGDRLLDRIDPEFREADETTMKVWRPVGRLANAATWVYGADLIGLPLQVTNVLLTVLIVVTIIAAVAAFFRVLDLVAGYFSRRAKRRQRRFDELVVPLATSTVRILAIGVAVLAAIAVFNDGLPSTLIGGLGIGGIAIALASQETLSNFIGSITLLFDRPFEVGDWVSIEGIEGEVESLGFRSTRIRTGLNSQVTLPNSKLAGASVDNLGRRKYRRYLNKLGLEYGTSPDRIEAFCEGIRELIRRHPHTRKDFYAAYFNDFGPSSLDVLVVVYFEVPDWATELRERHRLLADIARLAESIGVSFAFPTQTLHLHRGEAAAKPPAMADDAPDQFGARNAAEIAGELPNYQDRPGKVKFPGPTPLD